MTKAKSILLVNPLENIPKPYDMYPSGALVLIGTMLQNKGHNVRIVHMTAERMTLSTLKTIVLSFEPDIVGITMNTFQTRFAREVSRIAKEANANTLVVVGGPHPSALKLKLFPHFPHVDVVVYGEGEHTFLEIAEAQDFRGIKGICYNNTINEPRPRATDLDYVPLPNLDLVGFREDKFTGSYPVGAHPTMDIMASRGCPYRCTFCNKSIWGTVTTFRKPEHVIREVQWLHEEYGVKEVFFQDDTLNLNRKWGEEILHLIIDKGLNKGLIYKSPFRANERLVDEGFLRLAKAAGFWLIFYGVENGNDEMLARMKKGLTVGEIRRAFEITHRVGLKTTAAFIIGMPGETRRTVEETFHLWRQLKPCASGYFPATPFPGTELEGEVVAKGHLLETDYDKYDQAKFIVRTDELTKEDLERLHRSFIRRMRLVRLISDPRHILRVVSRWMKALPTLLGRILRKRNDDEPGN